MIKLKEFAPNPKETPIIRYGNEKRASKSMPSLTPGEMNAIDPHEPFDHMNCEKCQGEIGSDGVCTECGEDSLKTETIKLADILKSVKNDKNSVMENHYKKISNKIGSIVLKLKNRGYIK